MNANSSFENSSILHLSFLEKISEFFPDYPFLYITCAVLCRKRYQILEIENVKKKQQKSGKGIEVLSVGPFLRQPLHRGSRQRYPCWVFICSWQSMLFHQLGGKEEKINFPLASYCQRIFIQKFFTHLLLTRDLIFFKNRDFFNEKLAIRLLVPFPVQHVCSRLTHFFWTRCSIFSVIFPERANLKGVPLKRMELSP